VGNARVGGKVNEMKIVFVHGALVLDGAWWHRVVEPLGTLGLGSLAVELAKLRRLIRSLRHEADSGTVS
jgi:hypothetical protein